MVRISTRHRVITKDVKNGSYCCNGRKPSQAKVIQSKGWLSDVRMDALHRNHKTRSMFQGVWSGLGPEATPSPPKGITMTIVITGMIGRQVAGRRWRVCSYPAAAALHVFFRHGVFIMLSSKYLNPFGCLIFFFKRHCHAWVIFRLPAAF